MKTYTACIGKDLQCVRVNLFSKLRGGRGIWVLDKKNTEFHQINLKTIKLRVKRRFRRCGFLRIFTNTEWVI